MVHEILGWAQIIKKKKEKEVHYFIALLVNLATEVMH